MIIPSKKECEICHRSITILNAGPEFEKNLCACCYAKIRCANEKVDFGKKFDRRSKKSPFKEKTLHEIYYQGLKDGVKMYAYKRDKEYWVGNGKIERKLSEALEEIDSVLKK